jgi:hypothetical protein
VLPSKKGARWQTDAKKNRRYVGNPTLRRAFGFFDRRADLKGLPLLRMYGSAEELISSQM